ncbi:hypothetical protein GWI33_008202 [Rhynchophorus ferrugineus]|uniref:Cysteine dioxygenase n=1 Tax=Rhynchophorus ferrugineus TaxID=354439 RepID=A0A834IGZ4_RHYFE|nr:hypothetical protein GWI33_008202 [Rhynchophorus ferrugineus]
MSVCSYPAIEGNHENDDGVCEITLTKHLGHSLPEIGSLNDLVRELNRVFSSDNVNVDLVHYIMRAYKSNPIEWKKYAKFDRYRYTRNLVDDGNGKYNLMALCWGEGHGGSLEEVRYAWPKENEQEVKEIGRKRVENVSSYDTAISLHLYCPPYDKCHVFNQKTGKKSIVSVTFYSMFGKRNKAFRESKVPEDN